MDFNDYKNTYTQTIEDSIKFAGKEHDFFTRVKADYLKKLINRNLQNGQSLSLLDIGCGHGLIHKHIHSSAVKLTGVEMADEVLAIAKQTNPDVAYYSHDGKTLPFADHTFDLVFAICVMHHVPPIQWSDFLKEMHRVLKKGGTAVIFEHNPYNPVTRHIVAHNILDEDAVLLTGKTLKNHFKQAGFEKIKIRNILFTPFSHPIFRWLDAKLWWCPLGAQYYAFSIKS